jgi:hypothetical protein
VVFSNLFSDVTLSWFVGRMIDRQGGFPSLLVGLRCWLVEPVRPMVGRPVQFLRELAGRLGLGFGINVVRPTNQLKVPSSFN